MSKSIISEGKTTTEAIDKGLKELKVSKDKVEVKVLENENKKSFFSILTPRVVKVELTIKENQKEEKNVKIIEKKQERTVREYNSNKEEIEQAKQKVDVFLKQWLIQINEKLKYKTEIKENTIYITINGEAAGLLIGYRGEGLNAMQTILSTMANRNFNEKIRLILDIENYREKREKVLEELAQKVAKTVLRNEKSITLEPMSAYERKIIHSKLQENTRIETYSIGEGDNRRVVIAKVKK